MQQFVMARHFCRTILAIRFISMSWAILTDGFIKIIRILHLNLGFNSYSSVSVFFIEHFHAQ
jgi:hypothetical protein